jgi:hypothetical protein
VLGFGPAVVDEIVTLILDVLRDDGDRFGGQLFGMKGHRDSGHS